MILSTLMKKHAETYPDKLALFEFETEKGVTYKQLNEDINKIANGLLSLGLKRGEGIGVLCEHRLHGYELQWACLKTGIIFYSINHLCMPPVEDAIAFQINRAGAKVIFLEDKFADLIDSIRPQLKETERFVCIGSPPYDYMESIERWMSRFPITEPPEAGKSKPNEIVFVLATSGTTGIPKGLVYTYSSIWHGWLNWVKTLDVTPESSLWCGSGLNITTGSWPCNVFLYSGATVYLSNYLFEVTAGKQAGEKALQQIYKWKPTHFFTAPDAYPAIISVPKAEEYNPGTVRVVMCAGGTPRPFYNERTEHIFGCKYGGSYCAGEITPVTQATPEDYRYMDLTKGLLGQGLPAPFSRLKIVNARGEEVDAGEVGEIIVGGEAMYQGYLKNPEKTKEVLREGWFYTGDLGTLDEHGCLYVFGRKEFLITTEGKVVAPAMVDEVIISHPAVTESVTIGVPHKELGEAVKSIIVLRKGMEAKAEEIMDWCRERLPSYAVPKSIMFVDAEAIPRGAKAIPRVFEIKEKWGKEL
jgi:acyl-coenzyme A synthetase/AMP-(fatty) acid ligase